MAFDDDLLGLIVTHNPNAPPPPAAQQLEATDIESVDSSATLQAVVDESSLKHKTSSRFEEKQTEPESVYLEFASGDERNPINFSRTRKWLITLTACCFSILASAASSSYNLGFESMIPDLNCTNFQATTGLSTFAIGFGTVPLFTAAFSEEVGRQPVYLISGTGYMLTHVGIALSQNIQTVVALRFLQGGFSSVGSVMTGGTIADIWSTEERGVPMTIFSACAVGSMGLGPVVAGWIAQNPNLEWRWIQWISAIIAGAYIILLPFTMRETRSTVILTRLARRVRKKTGLMRYRSKAEDTTPSLRALIWTSCTRPMILLCTEPAVISISLWIGFAWGIVYCMVESIGPTFRDLYNFGIGLRGTVFLALVLPPMFGACFNVFQEALYKKHYAKRGPEARLYGAMVGGILFPVGMLIYAWTAYDYIPWIAPTLGIAVFMLATYTIYFAAFTYLADCYGPFASSALAGQSLARNIGGLTFPLFTTQMFDKLGYNWSNTIFGCIAALMAPIPIILYAYGPKIRASSKFSRVVMEMQAQH